MRKNHTMVADVEVKFTFPGLEPGEHEVEYPILEITFSHLPGRPAFTPRGEYAPIDPPEPAEVDFVSATLIDAKGLTASQSEVDEWARDYLDGDAGYRHACKCADSDHR
jgi:hypothetical protein